MSIAIREHHERQASARTPSAWSLNSQLIDIAEGLRAMLLALQADPHHSTCEMAAIRLDAARRHVQQLAIALRGQS